MIAEPVRELPAPYDEPREGPCPPVVIPVDQPSKPVDRGPGMLDRLRLCRGGDPDKQSW